MPEDEVGAKALNAMFAAFENRYPSKPQDDQHLDGSLPGYIHLCNARFYFSSRNPLSTPDGIWWRGRLDAVDAFWLGEIEQTPTY